MLKKPVTTEKAVKLIELENILLFRIDNKAKKPEIKKYFEKMFKVRVDKINTLTKGNQKFAYIKLDKKNPAIDIATKLGMI
jgi:ribosomal protein L23